jgi:hypothetical protein
LSRSLRFTRPPRTQYSLVWLATLGTNNHKGRWLSQLSAAPACGTCSRAATEHCRVCRPAFNSFRGTLPTGGYTAPAGHAAGWDRGMAAKPSKCYGATILLAGERKLALQRTHDWADEDFARRASAIWFTVCPVSYSACADGRNGLVHEKNDKSRINRRLGNRSGMQIYVNAGHLGVRVCMAEDCGTCFGRSSFVCKGA